MTLKDDKEQSGAPQLATRLSRLLRSLSSPTANGTSDSYNGKHELPYLFIIGVAFRNAPLAARRELLGKLKVLLVWDCLMCTTRRQPWLSGWYISSLLVCRPQLGS